MTASTTNDRFYRSFNIQVAQHVCSADIFRDIFLPREPPVEMNELEAKYDNFLEQLGTFTNEKEMYGPRCVLLSEMSLQILDHPLLQVEKDHRWLFFDHSTHSKSVGDIYTVDQFDIKPDIVALQVPKEHLRSYTDKPDKETSQAVGLRDKTYWASFGAIGKIKPGTYTSKTGNKAKRQARVCCNNTARFQPHRGGLFNLIAFQDRFILSWFSLDLVVFSEPIPWSEGFSYLSRLVTQIHLPSLESHPYILLPDPALSLVPKTEGEPQIQLHLTLQVGDTKKEYSLTTLFYRKGYSRKAFIALATPTTPGPFFTESDIRVVRFHWEDSERCFKEPETLNRIHQPYPVPGVVQPDMVLTKAYNTIPTNFPDYISQRSRSGTKQRERHLLVTKTLGTSLSSCSSIVEFLKVMYDALEVSRFLWEKKGIMHRDYSWGNVLVAFRKGEHTQRIPAVPHPDMEGCRFIDQVLLGIPDPLVHCLLADFEDAIDLRSKEPHKDGRDIAGTPMFIAMDRSKPRTAGARFDPAVLSALRELPCIPNREIGHLVKFWETLPSEALPLVIDNLDFAHQPIHEAESLFWILILFFTKARPDGIDIDKDNEDSVADARSTVYWHMATNTIGTSRSGAGRLGVLVNSDWGDVLHPELKAFVPMLFVLSKYFQATWHGYKIPPGCELHAHEAMQRVILGWIEELGTDDVKLDAQNPRDIFLDPGFAQQCSLSSTGPTRLNGVRDDIEKSANLKIPGEPGEMTSGPQAVADGTQGAGNRKVECHRETVVLMQRFPNPVKKRSLGYVGVRFVRKHDSSRNRQISVEFRSKDT